ncbi:hypothetical protein [Pseudomonas putida]|uniref:hypothetical protein n=1 Tax=Pseudomonas putida TaxID=303 RepID=UPI0023E41BBF|nr:hypothetical protein [Pseudomonas putida]MDF3930389.1 hypothetical protein [Pseudomonas putida]
MNYFAAHKASNTIVSVIHSAVTPTETDEIAFYLASKGRVSQYHEELKNHKPVDIYSVLPKPVIPAILPLTAEDEAALREYVTKHCRYETVEKMAFNWRVSEQVVTDILANTGSGRQVTTR